MFGSGLRVAFCVHLDLVEECIEFDQREYSEDNRIMATRAGPLPVIRLKNFFRLEQPADGGSAGRRRESLVVVKQAGSRVGLLVDELVGEYQSVIKPLGAIFDGLRALSGATILGNGTIAIVVDVPALLQWCDDEAAPIQPVDLRGIQAEFQGARV
ncbi:MAG: chemotaxis protein CheW [Leptospirales bacterium]